MTWSTRDNTNESIVEYGIDDLNMTALGSRTQFVDGGPEKRSQYIHRVNFNY